MPRQRTQYGRIVYVFPDDFPQRLVRFKEEPFRAECAPILTVGRTIFEMWLGAL